MFSWSVNAPDIYDVYISVLNDINIPRNWTKQQLLNEAEKRCMALGLKPPALKRKSNGAGYQYRKFPNVNWCNKDSGWIEGFKEYKKGRFDLNDWDKPFLMSDLDDDQFSGLIPIEAISRINEAGRDMDCLGLILTRRVAKWIGRFDKIQEPTNSCLPSTGLALGYSTGKNEEGSDKVTLVFGIIDVALVYAREERKHHIANQTAVKENMRRFNVAIDSQEPFLTTELDSMFMADQPPVGFRVMLEGYLLDIDLVALVRALNKKQTAPVVARPTIKKYFELKKYIWQQEQTDFRYPLPLKLLRDNDIVTIYAELMLQNQTVDSN